MKGEHTETSLMGQAHRLDLRIQLYLVAEESGAPVEVLGAQYNWLLVRSVLQDSHMNWLV